MAVFRSSCAPAVVVGILGLAGAVACSTNATSEGSSTEPDASVPDARTLADCPVPPTGLPTDLYCTGLYAARAPAQLAAGVMPYTPGVTLWSDGAEKHRFLQLPPGTKIDTTDLDAWKFPVDTKLWKEFRLGGALVETRILWKRAAGKWELGSYVWDATGTTATLNTSAPKGLVLPSGYEIPTQKDCDKCHHGGSDKVLGIEAVALGLPTAEGETLAALVRDGLLTNPPPTTSIALPEDATGKAAAALGYVHANCGMPCHSTRGIGDETHLVLRLRAGEFWSLPTSDGGAPPTLPVPATMTDAYRSTLDQVPTTGAVAQAFPGAARITPGHHDKSLVWMLPSVRTKYQMPPLVSHIVDTTAMQKLADWIDALPVTATP